CSHLYLHAFPTRRSSDLEFNLDIDEIELVKLGQKTENDFVGLNSGIMDQFAVGMGKENNAIYLDCNTLEYKYLPLELGDYEIIRSEEHTSELQSRFDLVC